MIFFSSRTDGSLRTAGRAGATTLVCALAALLGVAGCTDKKDAGADAPANTKTTSTANNAGAQPAKPAAFIPLTDELLGAEVKTVEGKSLKLADYKGKVVVVNMWATWCGPCRIETPDLVEMSEHYKGQGVEFIGLTTEQNDPDVEKVKEFLREYKVSYQTVYDEDGSLAGPLVQLVRGRNVIPQSFVITRDGRIIKHFSGFDPRRTPKLMREAVEQAVNDKGSV